MNKNIAYQGVVECPQKGSSTRDAVETAIDTAKEDKLTTWEGSFSKSAKKIARSQPKESGADAGR